MAEASLRAVGVEKHVVPRGGCAGAGAQTDDQTVVLHARLGLEQTGLVCERLRGGRLAKGGGPERGGEAEKGGEEQRSEGERRHGAGCGAEAA